MSPAEKTEIELTTAGSESDAEADVLYDDVFDNVSGNRTRTQIEGNGTPNFPNDDIFNVTGEAVGALKLNNNIIEWTSAIVKPVIRKFTCRWAVKGQVKIKRNTRTSLLDYGNGTCDDQATLTINGNVHSITLR